MIDGKPRSYRDTKPVALEAAEYLKRRYTNSEVAVKDLQSGELTPTIYKHEKCAASWSLGAQAHTAALHSPKRSAAGE